VTQQPEQTPRFADVEPVDARVRPARELWEPGHFYSPYPDLAWLRQHEHAIFAVPRFLPGIELRLPQQLRLAKRLAAYAQEEPFPEQSTCDHLYYYENPFFAHGDGIVLHCMLRMVRPRRLIEVGSGFSSALILETNARYLGGRCQCTFIEPSPDQLLGLTHEKSHGNYDLLAAPVQDVDAAIFSTLRAGDILFIDSSHVAKAGSDVTYLLFEVLPRLRRGVLVHLHDIFWPFEYPREWLYEGRSWNEDYLVRALLTGNKHLQVVWFNHYLWTWCREEIGRSLPGWLRHSGGSLWLRVAYRL
jgi:predicted O-methyltransferase YrrM